VAGVKLRRLAEEALDVRALVLDLLGTGSVDGEGRWQGAKAASLPAWELFLRSERCAAPAAAALERAGRVQELAPEVQVLLAHRRRVESVRALRARAQLAELGAVAHERGWRVLVLKGGVPLIRESSGALDLADLDILVAESQVPAVAAWLDERAARTGRYTSPRHVAARYVEGGVPVEIHHTTELSGSATADGVWDRAVPLPAGLFGLEPVEHAWFVLHHLTTTHYSRRGRIRDLLLLADALRACPRERWPDIACRVSADRFADPLRDGLAMAQALVQQAAIADRCRSVAFTRYVMHELVRRAGRGRSVLEAHQVVEWVFAFQAGREERRFLWERALVPSTGPSSYRFIGSIERLHPRLGLLWRRAARLVHRAAIRTLAWGIARWMAPVPPRRSP
jgi:hypothetical protein